MVQKLFFIDTETTGTKPYNGIIQIAGKIVFNTDGVFEEKERFNFTVRPFSTDKIEAKALEVNKKTEQEIMSYETPLTVYRKLILILEKYCDRYNKADKYFFVAYNSPFDKDMMWSWFEKCGDVYFGSWFWTPDICVMRKAADKLKAKRVLFPNFTLETVAKFFNITPDGDFHDAMADIDVTEKLYYLLESNPDDEKISFESTVYVCPRNSTFLPDFRDDKNDYLINSLDSLLQDVKPEEVTPWTAKIILNSALANLGANKFKDTEDVQQEI